MRFEQTAVSTADQAACWAALSDVASWPRWTASMRSVQPLDGGQLRPGARFRVRQPGLAPAVWRVTQVREGESFLWETESPGVRSVGFHGLDAQPGGGTRITLHFEQSGLLAGVFGTLLARRIRRFMAMEATGLCNASEARARPEA
jgi:uncharacterized membrane protein